MHKRIPFIRIASFDSMSKIVLTWKRKTVTLFMFTAQFYYTFFRVYLNSQVKNHKSDISCTPPIISVFFKKKSWRFLEKKSLQAHKNHVRWLRDLDFWESWSPNTTIRVRRLSRGPRIELLTNDKRSFFFLQWISPTFTNNSFILYWF